MNKATVAKLEKLHKGFKKHEEAIEENFSAKQVAIVRYRIGAEDNALHELKDVAAHFKCSVSYVTKVIRDVSSFIVEMDREYKKERKQSKVPVQSKSREGVKVAIMSAKIENGKVTVKHSDPELAKQVQTDLQQMVDQTMRGEGCGECPACIRNKKKELGQKALRLQTKASSRGFWAFIALVVALAIGIVVTVKLDGMSNLQAATGYFLTAAAAFAGLISYISGVSLMSERNGLLEALRKF